MYHLITESPDLVGNCQRYRHLNKIVIILIISGDIAQCPIVTKFVVAVMVSFSNDDGDSSENINIKMNSRFFKRRRDYSNLL